MRISDDRYSRDRLRLDLALRFIHHEARTHTIRAWTGLTDDRIRKFKCSDYGNQVRMAACRLPTRTFGSLARSNVTARLSTAS